MDRQMIVTKPALNVTHESYPTGPVLVHRADIASIAKALLLALNGKPEADGVAMLAIALGCEVKR